MGKFADELLPKFSDSTEPTLSQFKQSSVAWFIQRRIEESCKPGARPLGSSHLYTLRRLQREAIGKKRAAELKQSDLIDYARERKVTGNKGRGAQPATIAQDITYLRGVIRDYVELEELPQEALLSFAKSKRRLEKEQLIGKSKPRNRRPDSEELERLISFFIERNKSKKTKIPMDILTEFSYSSARRISETCRLKRGDVNVAKRTCWVRDLKNPKGKGEHAEFPLLGRAWEIVEARLAVIPDQPDARIFPYSAKSCSQAYTQAKKALGIKNLRLHDNRRESASRLFEEGYSVPEVALVTLHKNKATLLAHYTSLKPEDLHRGPASKRDAR